MRFENTYLYINSGEVWTHIQPGTILAIAKASIEATVPLHGCSLRIPTVILEGILVCLKLVLYVLLEMHHVPSHLQGQTFQKDPG